MKLRFVVVVLLVITLVIVSLNKAQAQWSAISSGYAVTTDKHGEDVLLGETVTAWAGTNNSEIYQVEFEWKNETEHVVFEENVTDIVSYTTPEYPPDAPEEIENWATDPANENITIYYANNTQIPNSLGNWTVQVFFYAPDGHIKGQGSDIIQIRATSLNVVPEVPMGTIVILLAMFGALGAFTAKKKRVPSIKRVFL
jgi:hypothetical protein